MSILQNLLSLRESSKPMSIDVDVAGWSDEEVKQVAKKYKCAAKLKQRKGPAGGNPLWTITGNEKNLREFHKEYTGFDKSQYADFESYIHESTITEEAESKDFDDLVDLYFNHVGNSLEGRRGLTNFARLVGLLGYKDRN